MINWAPTEEQEILQNVATLLATGVGSVPLSRALGTPQDVVDTPQSVAGARLQADAIKAVRTYEPRASIRSMTLSATPEGKLTATAVLGIP
jgi:phage baseplate assembly protein W